MPVNSDFKLIKEKKVSKDVILKITQNLMSGRIFVEFSSQNPRIVLQRNFQDDIYGHMLSEKFAKSITSTNQLREYFGLKKVKSK
jgi:hypothetical protein